MSGERLGELVRRLVGDLGHVALDDGDDEISTSRKGFAVIFESLQPRHVLRDQPLGVGVEGKARDRDVKAGQGQDEGDDSPRPARAQRHSAFNQRFAPDFGVVGRPEFTRPAPMATSNPHCDYSRE
jgi:hypothetical protein